MTKIIRTVCATVLAAVIATPALAAVPGKVLQTATVDGFTVNVLSFPTVARLRQPRSTTGTVETGVYAPGSSPYYGSPLVGAPYVSIVGGTATYKLANPAGWIAFIWGTPDSYNTVSLYGRGGTLIGTLNGADVDNALGIGNGAYVQIVSPTPVATVVSASSSCCFEVGNQISGQ
jgi:hypothetical protein